MPTVTAGVAVGTSIVTYPIAVAIGVPDSLALPVAVAAAGGASWAMTNRERIKEWGVGPIISIIFSWVFSWMFGVLFGPIAGAVLLSWLPISYASIVHNGALSVGLALIFAALAISHILPVVTAFARKKVDSMTSSNNSTNTPDGTP